MADDLASAVAAHVEREIAGVRERIDTRIDHEMARVWKELEQKYRSRIAIALSAALALMVAGFSVSAITATREANNAVIEFQNSIISKQQGIIASEDRVSRAAAELTKAEADLAAVRTQLQQAGSELKEATTQLHETRRTLDALVANAKVKQ